MSVPRDIPNIPDTNENATDTVEGPAPLREPLSPLESRLANAEAVERAPQTSGELTETRRRGRIEAETRRISDEVTRKAQEQRRLEAAAQERAAAQTEPNASPDSTLNPTPPAGPAPTESALTRPFPGSFTFKRMLVPLDGTFYAERALPYVTALARLTGASLILGHVSPPPVPAPAAAARRIAGDIVGRGREPQSSDIQLYLDAQRTLQAFRAPAVSIETIEDSDVVFGVRQLAERSEAGMLVLATHARQGLERRILGSTADGLVEQSHLPLLIIPPHVTIPPTAPAFARVLVPLDGSRVAEHALGLVVGLIQAAASPDVAHWDVTSWQITLFTVVESRVLEADALGYLEEVEARLAAFPLPEGVRITKQIVLGSPPGAIVAEANHGDQSPETTTSPFDLVAMATHGRGGLGRMLYGSVARYVLPRVAVPVLLVHPTDVSM